MKKMGKHPTVQDLHNMRALFLGEDWDSTEFLDWFGEFGLALIEDALKQKGEILPERYNEDDEA